MIHSIYTAVVKLVNLYCGSGVLGEDKAEDSQGQSHSHTEASVQVHNRGHEDYPSMVLKTLLNLPPLQLEVKGAAMVAAHRLSSGGR